MISMRTIICKTDTYSNVLCRYYIGEMVVQALLVAGTNPTFAPVMEKISLLKIVNDIYSLALYTHANVSVIASEDFVWDMHVNPQIIQIKSHLNFQISGVTYFYLAFQI